LLLEARPTWTDAALRRRATSADWWQVQIRSWVIPTSARTPTASPERNVDVFSERLRELAVNADITPWPHNAMRHSFGSYFLGKTKDENLTASEMGNSLDVIIKHYRALVKEVDIAAYWRIAPGQVEC